MRRIALALLVVGMTLLGAGTAQAGVLTSNGGIITYVANQGERNDVLVSVDSILGGTVPVYSIKDLDANPISIGGGPCQLINGIGMCMQTGVSSFIVDVRDGDDTAEIGDGVGIGAMMIGGRGTDTLLGGPGGDILKGNDGRDSLRGREGVDVYLGGRGRDNLQNLDGIADGSISCGDGNGDILRKDRVDPPGRHCEFSNHGNPSKPH
jgi:Ca2+-binding RTX toxin-like protein